tara:strand:+ start:44876 stop:45274 length:399 start_codon:yes stop_codon:yes gene_type:complete
MKHWESIWFDVIKRNPSMGIHSKLTCAIIERLQKTMPEEEIEGNELYRVFRNTIEELHLEQKEQYDNSQITERDFWVKKQFITRLISGRNAYATILKHLRKDKKIDFPIENTTGNSIIIPTKKEWANPYSKD